MKHREYIRIQTESDTAVLLIHGILGTPNHFADLIPLIPERWSVCNLLLDGHGGTVADFAATSMKKWKAQVEPQFCEIARKHERIIFVTHSNCINVFLAWFPLIFQISSCDYCSFIIGFTINCSCGIQY